MVIVTREKVKKIKEDVEWYLDKDKKYFMREYNIVKPLLNEAQEIAAKIQFFKLEKHNRNKFKLMISQLKKLERRQKWQQIRSRYPKLRNSMKKLLDLPILNTANKKELKDRIEALTKKESIFENDSLKKTAKQIEPRFRRKKLHEINWVEITAIISTLTVDIRDLVYIVTELKKAIEEI